MGSRGSAAPPGACGRTVRALRRSTTGTDEGERVALDTTEAAAGARPVPATRGSRRPGDEPVRGGRTSWSRRYVTALVAVETIAAAVAGAAVLVTRNAEPGATPALIAACLVLVPLWPTLLAA